MAPPSAISKSPAAGSHWNDDAETDQFTTTVTMVTAKKK